MVVPTRLAEAKEFQFSPFQCRLIIYASYVSIGCREVCVFYQPIHVTKMIVGVCTNTLLNNLCFKEKRNCSILSKKRKIQSLT